MADTRVTRRTLLRGSAGAVAATTFAGSAATLLGGCSGDDDDDGTLSFWNFYGPADDEDPQSQWFVDLVDEWNANNDVQVKLHYLPPAEYFSGTPLQTAFQGGEGPDIFMISPGDFLRYYNGGVLADLTDELGDARDDFKPGLLDGRSVDGAVYGLPMEVEPLGLFYSIPAYERAKLSQGDVPRTWDQLLDVADKLTGNDNFGMLFETAPGYYQNFTWYPFMWMGDGAVVDGSSSAFDSEQTAAALDLWGRTIDTGVSPRKAQGDGGSDGSANLGSGFVGMQQTGIWAAAALELDYPKLEYGVAPLPTPPGGSASTAMGGWAFVANSKGKNPSKAAEFVIWALGSTDKAGVERCRKWNTVVKTNLPARKSVEKSALQHGAFENDQLKVFVEEIAPTGVTEPRYPPEVYQPVSDAIQACQLDGANAADEAAKASEAIDTFLGTYDGAPIV
ncbi:sugar ABC transporter substrate-binding protein [Nocardioidaceae bacterium SCSIO 66511]|nr:sugar ABC transporter substrate-binding protein [Nocardioidaceae bacterium SCSIO 66511]